MVSIIIDNVFEWVQIWSSSRKVWHWPKAALRKSIPEFSTFSHGLVVAPYHPSPGRRIGWDHPDLHQGENIAFCAWSDMANDTPYGRYPLVMKHIWPWQKCHGFGHDIIGNPHIQRPHRTYCVLTQTRSKQIWLAKKWFQNNFSRLTSKAAQSLQKEHVTTIARHHPSRSSVPFRGAACVTTTMTIRTSILLLGRTEPGPRPVKVRLVFEWGALWLVLLLLEGKSNS